MNIIIVRYLSHLYKYTTQADVFFRPGRVKQVNALESEFTERQQDPLVRVNLYHQTTIPAKIQEKNLPLN